MTKQFMALYIGDTSLVLHHSSLIVFEYLLGWFRVLSKVSNVFYYFFIIAYILSFFLKLKCKYMQPNAFVNDSYWIWSWQVCKKKYLRGVSRICGVFFCNYHYLHNLHESLKKYFIIQILILHQSFKKLINLL